MISKGFIKSSFIYTLAGTLPLASSILLLPFYTRFLGTDALGAFWIYLAFSVLVQIIVTFSFDASIYIHFHEYKNDKKKLSEFISSSFVLMVIIGFSIAAISICFGAYLFHVVFKDQAITFYPYGLITVFTGFFQALFKVYTSLLQSRQKPELFFRSNLLSFSLIAGFTIIGLVFYPTSLIGPIGGRFLAAFVTGGWAFSRILKEFGLHFNYSLLVSSFSFNFYSFVYQLQQWIMNYFDRILISFFLPLSEVGVYGFAVSCLALVEFVVNGLYSSFMPKVVSIIMDQPEKIATPEINRYYYGLTAVSMLLVALCILLFPLLINTFTTKADYKLSIQYLPYAALYYLFKSLRMYFAIPYGILKYNKPLPIIYIVIVAIKIGLLVLLIREFGIYGVIISSILSYWAEIALLYYNGKDKFHFKFNVFKLLLAPSALAIGIAVFEPVLGGVFSSTLLHSTYLIVCITLLTFAFRNELKLINPLKILR